MTWALNSVSQGDDIVLVSRDQVYKLQGNTDDLLKFMSTKARVDRTPGRKHLGGGDNRPGCERRVTSEKDAVSDAPTRVRPTALVGLASSSLQSLDPR